MSDDEGAPPAKVARFGEIDASQVKDSAAAIAAGIAAGNVEVVGADAETMDLPQNEDEKKRQEKILQEFEARRKLQALVVPTNDQDVRQRLRSLGEPITLFGERQMERRDRLRKILLQAVEEGRDLGDKEAEDELMEQVALQNELFYTEGPQELLAARENIARYSLVRAKQRIESQRRKQNDPDEDDAEEAAAATNTCKQLANQCSELGDERPIQSCGFSPDGGLFATAGWGGSIKLWSVPACEKKLVIGKAHEERLTGLAWHPEARLSLGPELANIGVASADCTATLWSLEGKKLRTLEGHTNRLARCCFHPMGAHFGTASYDKSWILWDLATGEALLEQEGHSRAVYGLAFQNDGSLAVSGGLDAIGRVWDLRTGRSIHVLKGHAKGILSCAFNPNGYQVVTGSLDHTARVWDLRKRECIYTLPGHRHLISEVKFEPMDGHYFITAGYDNLVKVWSASNYSLVKILAGHENKVMSADICPDGSGLIASVSYDRTIKYWMPEEDFSAMADGPSAMEA